MIIIIFTIAFIWAIVDIIRLPKPPNDLNSKELEHYYKGGWKEYETQKRINEELYLIQLDKTKTASIKLHKEIEFLNAQIAMLEDLQRLIENDMHNGSGNEKVNLSKIISIDKQIHIAQKKIDKLNNELESL